MNSKHKTSIGLGGFAKAATSLLAIAALMTMGIADAAPRGAGGGGSGGGRMAKSSVSSGGSMSRAGSGMNAGNRTSAGNNLNSGNRVNNGNINIGNDVNVDIDRDYHGGYHGHGYHGGYYHHPVAAGIVIGAVAVTTAAVVGSYYRTLPTGCSVVVKNGISYHYCGSVYYQQTYSGNDVVYVVVQP